MAKSWILRALLPAVAIVVMGADAPDSHDFAVPIELKAGTVLQISVDHTASRAAASGPAIELKSGARFKLDVAPTDAGYHVRQFDYQVTSSGPANDQQKAVAAAAAFSNAFEYEADEYLVPLKIANWDAYTANMAQASAALSIVTGADPVTVADLRRMTPEQGAAGLAELNFLSLPQGMGLDLKKPVTGKDTVVNSAAGVTMVMDYSYSLESIDRTAGKAVVVTREAFDPASAKAATDKTVADLTRLMPRGVTADPKAVAALKLERTTQCRYDMDLKTGLTLKADCTRTVGLISPDLKTLVNTDRWVITQTVVGS